MLLFSPLMIEDIPMTVATPITTPRTVRNDRSVFFRSESSASSRISLISQSHNRIEVGRFRCGIDPKEQADTGGHAQSERNRPPFDRSGKGRQPRNRQCNRGAEQNSDDAADQCKSRRLDEKLNQDVVPPRSRRFADSYLARPFSHGYEHDVHDNDAADDQRNRRDADRHRKKRAADIGPDLQEIVVRVEREVVLHAVRQMPSCAKRETNFTLSGREMLFIERFRVNGYGSARTI